MGLITRWLGLDDALTALTEERKETRAMMREILQIACAQVDVTARMSQTLNALAQAYQVDGPPEGRPGFGDEAEAILWEQRHES